MPRIPPVLVLLAILCATASAQKLKVYILAGQSNMQGHAKVETFDYIGDDPETRPLLRKMVDRRGDPVVLEKVWISYLTSDGSGNGVGKGRLTAGYGARRRAEQDGGKIGPEFTFGITMSEATRAPILLIKCAWGGKSLHTDFRPPSAGPFEFSEAQIERMKRQGKDVAEEKAKKRAATGRYYRLMMDHVKAVLADLPGSIRGYPRGHGHELAGFVWFQGWNDMVDSGVYPERHEAQGYAEYSECLAGLIHDVREELEAPELPFVIGVMGVGGEISEDPDRVGTIHRNFRAAMAAPAARPEFAGSVVAVPTAPYWDERLAAIDEKRQKVRHLERQLRKEAPGSPNADGSMSPADQRAHVARYREELLGDAQEVWDRGASNAGYHYLGCAKTMALIGEAFAEALIARDK